MSTPPQIGCTTASFVQEFIHGPTTASPDGQSAAVKSVLSFLAQSLPQSTDTSVAPDDLLPHATYDAIVTYLTKWHLNSQHSAHFPWLNAITQVVHEVLPDTTTYLNSPVARCSCQCSPSTEHTYEVSTSINATLLTMISPSHKLLTLFSSHAISEDGSGQDSSTDFNLIAEHSLTKSSLHRIYESLPTWLLQTQLLASPFHPAPMLPIICAGDQDSIFPLMHSALHQRITLCYNSLVVGLVYTREQSAIRQVLVGWTETPTEYGIVRLRIPNTHDCVLDTADTEPLFDLAQPASGLALLRFLRLVAANSLRHHNQWVSDTLSCRTDYTSVASWRADTFKQEQIQSGNWKAGVSDWYQHVVQECAITNRSGYSHTKISMSEHLGSTSFSSCRVTWPSESERNHCFISGRLWAREDDESDDGSDDDSLDHCGDDRLLGYHNNTTSNHSGDSQNSDELTGTVSSSEPRFDPTDSALETIFLGWIEHQLQTVPGIALWSLDYQVLTFALHSLEGTSTQPIFPTLPVMRIILKDIGTRDCRQEPFMDAAASFIQSHFNACSAAHYETKHMVWSDVLRWCLIAMAEGEATTRLLTQTRLPRCREFDRRLNRSIPCSGPSHPEFHVTVGIHQKHMVADMCDWKMLKGTPDPELPQDWQEYTELRQASFHTDEQHAIVQNIRLNSCVVPQAGNDSGLTALKNRLMEYPLQCRVDALLVIDLDLSRTLSDLLGTAKAAETIRDISFVLPHSDSIYPEATGVPSLEAFEDGGTLHIPILLVIHQAHELGLDEATRNEQRLGLTSAARFLAVLGIKDFPVYGLITSGPYAYPSAAWYSGEDDCVCIADRNPAPHRFDLSQRDGAARFICFLSQVQNHAEDLKGRLEELRLVLLRRLGTESGRSSLRWTITAQIDEHNLRRDTGGQSERRGGEKR